MLDRTIPFFNMILKCSQWTPTAVSLPVGFGLRSFAAGDEAAWAALEREIGDFSSQEEALAYFQETYGKFPEELRKRAVVLTHGNDAVGFCIAWRDKRGSDLVASLHWLVVSPAWEGRGLGRALVQRVMEIYQELGEAPVYLHTQPWSYRALLLYVHLGFRIQTKDSFADYENQYSEAMAALRGVLPPERFQELLDAAE